MAKNPKHRLLINSDLYPCGGYDSVEDMARDRLPIPDAYLNLCPLWALLLVLFLPFPSACSEKIVLKSGKTVEGTIEERTDKFIQVNVGLDFPITYYHDEVKAIISDTPRAGQYTAMLSSEGVLKQADGLEQQGLSLIDEGRMDEGLSQLRKAIDLDPKANRHLNLGMILSGNGVSLFKSGHKKEARSVFKESEQELLNAIKLFDPNTESIFLSQAYFLLGELYAQGLNDKNIARKYYDKSISFYPNPAAERGLKALKF